MSLSPRQFTQLPMFMQAQDLHDSVKFGDQGGGSRQSLMDRKWSQAARSGLVDEIGAHGIEEPLQIEWHGAKKPMLFDGHHRLAVALEQSPHTEVPVVHHDVDEMQRIWNQQDAARAAAASPKKETTLDRVRRMQKARGAR